MIADYHGPLQPEGDFQIMFSMKHSDDQLRIEMENHTFSQPEFEIDLNNSDGLVLHQNKQYSHTPAQGESRIYKVWQYTLTTK